MALFESYERREKQILAVINQYGINTIEECADVCKAKGLDIYKLVEGIQPICFENLHSRLRYRYQEGLHKSC